MALRARRPKVTDIPRFKAFVYAAQGTGKTHFCCSFPDTYYIDSEGLEDYPQFVDMLHKNNSELIYLTELTEIIKEVKDLLSTKHTYKTLVIDSLSFPYGWMTQMEADRLQKKSPNTEGTEFGANKAKAVRLAYQLGILLTMLDMNVIVTSHERVKYSDGEEVGKTFDVTDKLAYSLGAVLHMRLQGKQRKFFVEKSRYTQFKANDLIDFEDGYQYIKSAFGEEIFVRESKPVDLATNDQIGNFNRLSNILGITDEQIQVKLRTQKAESLESVHKEVMEKWIETLTSKINGTKGETA